MGITILGARNLPVPAQEGQVEWLVRQLALDLHDGPTQYVCAALMQVEALSRLLEQNPGAAPEMHVAVGRLRALLEHTGGELRGLIGAVSPPEVSGCGLPGLLSVLVHQHQALTAIPVQFDVAERLPEPPPTVRLALYRVLQEALSNAHRHSGASWIAVKLGSGGSAGRRELWLSVEDDGCGFEPEAAPTTGHLGLAGMRERLEALGGTLTIWSALGAGTLIRASLEVP